MQFASGSVGVTGGTAAGGFPESGLGKYASIVGWSKGATKCALNVGGVEAGRVRSGQV